MKNYHVPRTLNEAFGPYAELEPMHPPAPTWRGYAISVIVALALGGISWLLHQ